MDLNAQRVLTVAETARELRLGRSATYEAVKRGEIPSVRIGRRILIPVAALERLLAEAGRAEGER
ncbi:MAG: helix-turn-helix domain-containing protein [Armatimonadetes bacterium]|nr:helix-turn-helix domain-containing protein [Armatimonadota bacterium]